MSMEESMDYQKIYDNLVQSRKNRLIDGYVEKHHIIPKCLGGTDDKDNLVILTYREHFIAHWLLVKIHKTHSGINYAFLCMLRKQSDGRMLNSRMFETIKKNFSKFKKLYCTIENPGKSENSRNAARKRMIEKNPTSLHPEKNRTAQPIRVYFYDGRIEEFRYAKELSLKYSINYGTVKLILRNIQTDSKKYGIQKIERIPK
jgi:hypothetical protein